MKKLMVGAASLLVSTSMFAADGTWNVNANGTWSVVDNWYDETIASGAGYKAYFTDIFTGDRTVTLDTDLSLGGIDVSLSNNRRLTISGAYNLTFDNNAIINVGAGSELALTSAKLQGAADIQKNGAGTLRLGTSNLPNSFTGSLNVNNGGLTLTSTSALAAVPLTLGGGADNVTFTIAGIGDGTQFSVGGITVAEGGAGTVKFAYAGGVNSVINIQNGKSVTLNKNIEINSTQGPLTITGLVTGDGGIVKTGAGGSLSFNNTSANDFKGGVTISQGAVRLTGGAGGLGSGTLTMGDANTGNANVTLHLGFNQGTVTNDIRVASITGSGTAIINTLNGVGNGSTKTLSGKITLERDLVIEATNQTADNTNITVSGVITGAGGLVTKSLAKTQVTLSNTNNDYSGGTTVAAGTLLVNATGKLGTGDVTVSTGATLTVQNSSAFADLINLSLEGATSALNFNFTGGDTTLNLSSLTLGGVEVAAGLYGISEFAAHATYTGDWFKNSTGLNNVYLNIIPEPSVYAMLLGGVALLAALRRLRAKTST